MTRPLTIALDAMGGDKAPKSVILGAFRVLAHLKNVHFIFFGDEAVIAPMINHYPKLVACSTIRHTLSVVQNEDKPTTILRSGQETSMWKAIESVANGDADCIVSGGNTGALMVLARKHLKMLPGIDRPAIAAPLPTLKGQTIVLDLGANIDCTPDHLQQFALMGAVYAKAVLGIHDPTIGVINVGEEEQKGTELVRKTAGLLREAHIPGRFIGFIEGNDIGRGVVDVAVTDGFTGNVLLKTAEGTAHFIRNVIKNLGNESLLNKICLLLALPVLNKLRRHIDPRLYNGAMFVGLGGVCVKSHGSMDEVGFANAIKIAADLVLNRFNEHVAEDLSGLVKSALEAA
jgi:glycerol-3-phosphate acyltransferase PlsX